MPDLPGRDTTYWFILFTRVRVLLSTPAAAAAATRAQSRARAQRRNSSWARAREGRERQVMQRQRCSHAQVVGGRGRVLAGCEAEHVLHTRQYVGEFGLKGGLRTHALALRCQWGRIIPSCPPARQGAAGHPAVIASCRCYWSWGGRVGQT